MAFRNVPPNGFPAIPDIEDLEGVENDVSTLKTTTAGLTEDVSDLEEQKANQITIALSFNPETTYDVGDLVYYNGLSYRCTNAHTGEWDADDFAGTTIANELASVKSGLTNLVKSAEFTVTTDYTGNARLTTEYRKIIAVYVNSNPNPYSLCHARPWWLNNQYTPQLNGTYIEVTTTEDAYNHIKEEELTGIYYYI